jgi:hypothetical protein
VSIALTRCSQEIASLAAALLAREDACLLSLALTPGDRNGKSAVVLFDRAMTPHPAQSPMRGAEERPLREIKFAAAALFGELNQRWPAYAPPLRLGVITDGMGLGFCPQDPWPLAPDWLSRQIQGQSSLTEILPFDPRSTWRMLTGATIGRAQ